MIFKLYWSFHIFFPKNYTYMYIFNFWSGYSYFVHKIFGNRNLKDVNWQKVKKSQVIQGIKIQLIKMYYRYIKGHIVKRKK